MSSPRRAGDLPSPTRGIVHANGNDERPSLLPAFEPLSSSPLPSASKMADARAHPLQDPLYPTPIPTSETGLASSPPRRPTRPAMMPRTVSEISRRAPLAEVPTFELELKHYEVLLGRSAISGFQFSTSSLVSRVHLKVVYDPTSITYLQPWGKINITCLGWNGAYVHYNSEARKLAKDESIMIDDPLKEIMIDVCDSRVFLQWPRQITKKARAMADAAAMVEVTNRDEGSRESSPTIVRNNSFTENPFVSSPPASPPFANASIEMVNDENDPNAMPLPSPTAEPVQVYEDSEEPELRPLPTGSTHSELGKRKRDSVAPPLLISEEGDSDAEHVGIDGESDEDDSGDEAGNSNEENDPTIFSFGPAGFNITNRFASFSATETFRAALGSARGTPRGRSHGRQMSAFSASSSSELSSLAPENTGVEHRSPSKNGRPTTPTNTSAPPIFKTPTPTSSRRQQAHMSPARRSPSIPIPESPIHNHVINQLAYSRLHSMPLSTILGNLPTDMKTAYSSSNQTWSLTTDKLRVILHHIPCVGEIGRSGKDAAGKPLEDEYYYVAEMDSDEMRRQAVQGSIGGTGLRAARRNHKQYYWKRPRV